MASHPPFLENESRDSLALPLSVGQTDVWRAQQLAPGSTFYNVGGYVDFFCAVEHVALERAISRELERTDTHHFLFSDTADGPRQYCATFTNFKLTVVDMSGDADPHAAAISWMRDFLDKPFDLTDGPLFRYALLKVAEEHMIWVGAWHHLIADAFGAPLFVRRVVDSYQAYRSGTPADNERWTTWADFLRDEAEYAGSARHDRDRTYWRELLKGHPNPVTLSGKSPKWPDKAIESRCIIRSGLVAQLEKLGAEHNCTLAAVMLAVTAAYLSRMTGSRDIVIGMPVAARTNPKLRQVVGFLSNVVPLRLVVQQNAPFSNLLRLAGVRVREAFRHQRYWASAIRRDLGLAANSPNIFGTVMNFVPSNAERAIDGRPLILHVFANSQRAEDLMINVDVRSDTADTEVQFSGHAAHYDSIGLQRHMQRFLRLLEACVVGADLPTERLALLPDAERSLLLDDWGIGRGATKAATLAELFEAQVALTPQAIAIEKADQGLTYAKVNARANQVAQHLIRQGVGPESLVGLCIERSAAMVIGLLGIAKAGAAYLPLDLTYPSVRLKMMLADARPQVVLASGSTSGAAALESVTRLLNLEDILLDDGASDLNPRTGLLPSHPAYVIYTSGSSGTPKGVVITHQGVAALAEATVQRCAITPHSRVLQFASLNFDGSLWEIVMALGSGATLVLAPPDALGGSSLRALLVSRRITQVMLPPVVVSTLQPGPDLAIECLTVGGDAFPPALIGEWSSGVRMINAYGPTETTVCATLSSPLRTGIGAPIGAPIPGTRVYVLDAWLEPVPIGVIGEICIAGTGLARGYLNRTVLTAERFVPDPFGEPGTRMYRSGDLGRWRSDAALDHLGRSDSQVKIRGFRIELGEIEAALTANPAIAQAAVVARDDHRGVKSLAAYLVLEEARDFDAARFRAALSLRLPDYMIPSSFIRLAELPLTPSGKLDRRALPAAKPGFLETNAYEPPDGPVEATLARLLMDLLGIDRVSRYDSFFAMGLNSLMVIELIERLSQRGWKLDARAVFEQPTVAGLAATLEANDGQPTIPPNRIAETASRITPEQLPLVTLNQAQIDAIVSTVPGGAVNVKDIYPLVPLQEGLLAHHRISQHTDAYVLRTLLSFDARDGVDRFLSALQSVVDRHDVLRTSIVWEALPCAVQVVWRRARVLLEMAGDCAALDNLWRARREKLDVRVAPMLRCVLAHHSSTKRWLLLLECHHIVVDHTTLEFILAEVRAHLNGTAERLADPVPFRNFVALARFPVADGHEAFFREMLAGIDEPTAPFGLLDVRGDGTQVEEAQVALPSRLARELRSQARSAGVTVSSLFHVVWGLVLARTSGRADVVFGTVLFGRMHGSAGVERALGLFMNTLPLRLNITQGAVIDVVRATHVKLGQLLHHEQASLRTAQRCSALPATVPLFSALLNYRHTHGTGSAAGEILPGIELVKGEERTSYPLALFVDDLESGFRLTAQAPTSVDPGRLCGLVVTALENLVRALAAAPDTDIRNLPVLAGAERRQLLGALIAPTARLTPTKRPSADTYVRLFAAQCERSPQAVAVGFNGDELTYAALNEASNRIAQQLSRAGLGPGEVIAVCMSRSPLLLASLLAIQKSAAAYLPLDPEFPVDRLAYMLADSGAKLLLTAGAIPAALTLPPALGLMDVSAAAECAGTDRANSAESPGAVASIARPLDLAYVIYTSGSTGLPKGVAISQAALCTNLRSMQQRLRLTDRDVVAATTTVSFDPAFVELFLPLMVGARIELLSRETATDGLELVKLPAARRPTVLQATPTAWRMLLNSDWLGDRGLRAFCGGEAMARDLADALLDRTAEVWNLYGPTETTIWSAVCKVERSTEKMVPIGDPIQGMKYYILDAALEPAPIGATGELYIGGTGLARGYYNQPALTAARFVPDPYGEPGARLYRSGDLARWRPDGKLDYLGRNDQQVKLRGARIELGEIEAVLRDLEDVKEAAVILRGAGDAEHLAAYVIPRSGTDINTANWRHQLAVRLPGYMVPLVFVSLDAMPLTPSGKLDRRALLAAAPSMPERSYEPPKTSTERRVESIWRQVLRVDRIGREDGFFELGGHSLSLLRVASRLRDEFGLELPLKIMFGARTLASMAEQIDQALIDRVDPPNLSSLVATEWNEPSPLSYSQERMWLIQSLSPTTTAYNIVLAVKLHGHLHLAALCDSVDELMRRHEILRTKVCLVEDQPRQVVDSWHSGALEIIELRGEHTEADAVRQATLQARVPFDLAQGAVLRARLYRVDHDQHVLTLIVHHIAADQWSLGIMGRELAKLYNARRKGAPVRLEALPVSYRDYAQWQRSGGLAVVFDQQLAYWRRQLSNLPTVNLPIDRPRPKLWTLRGATYECRLDAELLNSIQQFGHRVGATLFMALFAGFAALLHRITGQTDIPVGVPVANRTHTAVEGLVGTFVNTVVLRTDLIGNPCFGGLLSRIRDTAVEAFAAQDVSFDRLVQEIGQRGDPSRAPLVQVMFNVVNAPMHGIEFEELTWSPLALDAGGAQFELSFTIDTEVTHILSVAYSTDLFDHSTVERMVGQYLTLISAAIAAPEKPIRRLPLLPEQQLALLRRWNDTAMSLPRLPSLVALFEATAAASPDATAISVGEARFTYAELNAEANRLAAVLCTLNVDRGALVAVCISRSPLLLIGLFAIQKCGAAYLPLDPEFPAERLHYMLSDSDARLLLTSGGLPSGMLIPERVKVLDADAALNCGLIPSTDPATFAANVDRYPQPCDRAYVIYTSGSSGRPKGVVVTHGALLNFLYSMRVRPGLTTHDVLAAVTTISFDIAAVELYLPLMVGARIELVPRQTASDGAALAQLLKASGATVMQATPATWRLLLEAGWSGGEDFRALCGGETLSRPLADSLLKCVGQLWNLYGPTETTIWSAVERIESGTSVISIGSPIANTQIAILDPAGEQVPVGVVGEIAIGGDGVAVGYHGRPALTAERFVPDCRAEAAGRRLYLTGDLGRWGADGKLYHMGRRDTQVKVRGFRIELAEIERVLEEQLEVRQAVVVVREAQVDDPRLIAYAIFRAGQDLTMGEVKERLRRRLPEFMVPSIVIPLQSMPVTPNGKADRAALPDPFRHELPSREPPATTTERMVAETWKSVLKIQSVWAGDNFFDLGGYSLLSLRVVKLLEERTGRKLDPRVLFFKDLRQVADLLETEPASTASSDV